MQDQETLRLPAWQFDIATPNGTVPRIPEVLRELAGRPLGALAQALWFTPKLSLDGRSPALADGDLDDVLAEARTIGA